MSFRDNLISVSAFFCEKILHEKDNVASAIRIIDIITTTPPADGSTGFIEVAFAISFRAKPEFTGECIVNFIMINTVGERRTTGAVKLPFVSQANTEYGVPPTAANASLRITLEVKRYGTCYLCAEVEGDELIRVPLTVLPLKPPAETH